MTSSRLQRYATFLSGFNYEAAFKKRCKNTNVDCLSRASLISKIPIENSITEEVHQVCLETVSQISSSPQLMFHSFRKETLQDKSLSNTLQQLREDSTFESEFTIEEDILFRSSRVVVPKSLQPAVLKELYRTHLGITKMK